MRGCWILLVALFLIPFPASAQGEPDLSWLPWVQDAEGDTTLGVDRRADILAVDVAVSDGWLHVRLVSAQPVGAGPDSVPGYDASDLEMRIANGTRDQTVSFQWRGDEGSVRGLPSPTDWGFARGSTAWHWHGWVSLEALLGEEDPARFVVGDLELAVSTLTDEDSASGEDIEIRRGSADTYGVVGTVTLAQWMTVEGPDLGGGAAVAVADDGRPQIAYYIYSGTRDTEPGLYLAHLDDQASSLATGLGPDARWQAMRVADVQADSNGDRDDQMRTKLAMEGATAHILYQWTTGSLAQPDALRYVRVADGEPQAPEDPTPRGKDTVGGERTAAIAVGAGRVVAAVPVGPDVWLQERTDAGWSRIATLDDAWVARVRVTDDGVVHAAWADQRGALFWAAETGDFAPEQIASGIEYGWHSPETDGSFDLAVASHGAPAILYNGQPYDTEMLSRLDAEQFLATRQIGITSGWSHEAVPLVPMHGNPQYTLRLGLDGDGRYYAAGGYGGLDGIAIRIAEGRWIYESAPRFDVWDMAVSPDGRAHFGYSEPHGGTTVAITTRVPGSLPAEEDVLHTDPEVAAQDAPGLAGALVLVSVLALVIRRR